MELRPERETEGPTKGMNVKENLRLGVLSLQGILAVSLSGDGDSITSVNIIARDGQKSRGQIVQDVISLALITGGLRLEPDDVDVVFTSGSDLLQTGHRRPRLVSIETTYSAEGVRVQVILALSDKEKAGTAHIETRRPNPRRLVEAGARATLSAAEELLSGRCQLHLRDIVEVQFAGDRVVLVAVSAVPDVWQGSLVGAVRVRGDLADAAARAVLDAVNRTFRF